MKYALVTGCDHGVGLALAEELATRGYTVAACRLNRAETRLEQLQERFPRLIHLFQVDIARDDSVAALAKAVAAAFPRLDLLINNAGILGHMEAGLEDKPDFDLIQQVLNVNAVGPLRVTAALFPLLKKGEDRLVVNISSEAGSIADCERTGWFGYCMSKAANNMQGALVHNNLRQLGGRVLQLHPGHVATYMRGHLDTTAAISPEVSARGILHVALDSNLPVEDRPLYLDYSGEALPW